MSVLVQKFGGTSVADIDRMRHVANIVADERRAGRDLVVVVSAMAGETNRLLELAHRAVDMEPVFRRLEPKVALPVQIEAVEAERVSRLRREPFAGARVEVAKLLVDGRCRGRPADGDQVVGKRVEKALRGRQNQGQLKLLGEALQLLRVIGAHEDRMGGLILLDLCLSSILRPRVQIRLCHRHQNINFTLEYDEKIYYSRQ